MKLQFDIARCTGYIIIDDLNNVTACDKRDTCARFVCEGRDKYQSYMMGKHDCESFIEVLE